MTSGGSARKAGSGQGAERRRAWGRCGVGGGNGPTVATTADRRRADAARGGVTGGLPGHGASDEAARELRGGAWRVVTEGQCEGDEVREDGGRRRNRRVAAAGLRGSRRVAVWWRWHTMHDRSMMHVCLCDPQYIRYDTPYLGC